MQSDVSYNSQSVKKSTFKPSWYAVYTRPCHEKKVYEQLKLNRIEAYLPLQTTFRQWSDRKKKISKPLFSCYLFVFISVKDYYKVLNIPGVIRYVSFEGKAVTIPEKQIQLIKYLFEEDFQIAEVLDFIPVGTRVKIITGLLMGVTGELVEYAGKKRVIIRIEEICKSIMVNVSLSYLKLAG